MDDDRRAAMAEATRLTREGRVAEATALIQQTLNGSARPTTPQGADQPPSSPAARPPAITRIGHGLRRLVSGRKAATHERPTTSTSQAATSPAPTSPATTSPPPTGVRAAPPSRLGAVTPKPAVTAPSAPGGTYEHRSFRNDAGERHYGLYVPTRYAGRPVPLVVMLHGGTQTADDFAAGTRMNELAERDTFIVVYPEQSRAANRMGYWNWFEPGHQRRDAGEPSLIAGITREVMRDYAVDERRVSVAGMSAGGAMAAVMAASYPELYAAAGIHSGVAHGVAHDVSSALAAMKNGGAAAPAEKPQEAVPLIVIHGDQDAVVDQSNAVAAFEQARQAAVETGPDVRLTTTAEPGTAPGGRAYTKVVLQRAGKPIAELWTIHGAGHAWSGGSPDGSHTDPIGPDASAELVRVFREHPRSE